MPHNLAPLASRAAMPRREENETRRRPSPASVWRAAALRFDPAFLDALVRPPSVRGAYISEWARALGLAEGDTLERLVEWVETDRDRLLDLLAHKYNSLREASLAHRMDVREAANTINATFKELREVLDSGVSGDKDL
jgi:hypothetical protein